MRRASEAEARRRRRGRSPGDDTAAQHVEAEAGVEENVGSGGDERNSRIRAMTAAMEAPGDDDTAKQTARARRPEEAHAQPTAAMELGLGLENALIPC